MTAPKLTVVVAVKGALANLPAIVAGLRCAARADIEFIFVVAGDTPQALSGQQGIRIISSGAEALVPELWRDGIVQARADRVALIASHCVPGPQWIEQLERADLVRHAGVGGSITLAAENNAVQKAIYLQRFSHYTPARRGGIASDIAADNAIYRKHDITRHGDLLAAGFWEPSFHRRFARDGLTLCFDPELRVSFHGDESPMRFVGARYAHGREYGRSRARSSGIVSRVGLLLLSPLIAPLLIARIVARASGEATLRGALLVALPWLIVFAAAWSAGESRGYLDALFGGGSAA